MNAILSAPAEITAIKFDGYKIQLLINGKGKHVARLYKYLTVGKNKDTYKLIEGYYFHSEGEREVWVREKISTIKQRVKDETNRRQMKKEAVGNHSFKCGDVLYQSWGYDQTNINFYQVVEVLPKSVKIRPISQIMVEGSDGFMSEYVKPDINGFTGEAIIRPVKASVWGEGISYHVSNGRHSLSLYTHGERGLYQSHYA